VITATLDDKAAMKRLEAVKRAGKDLRPVFKLMKPVLRVDVGVHFARSMAPDGAWPGRSQASWQRLRHTKGNTYRKGKRKGALNAKGLKRFRNQLGRLKGAYRFKLYSHRMEMISRVPWAGVHQHGGTVGRGSRIPKREFMWASRQSLERYHNFCGKLLLEAFKRGVRL